MAETVGTSLSGAGASWEESSSMMIRTTMPTTATAMSTATDAS
ncbi:MAG: hypothetical protein WBV89_20745 [Ilumatobacter sp.]